jgi:uncharacterized Zn finger protein
VTEQSQNEAEAGTQQYPYSVKIEQTALGARVSVHAYAHLQSDAWNAAIQMYVSTRDELAALGLKLAPEEPTPKKEVTK